MADFAHAQKFAEAWEGFHSIDPDDPGGETLYGIARNRHPKWDGWAIWDRDRKPSKELETAVKAFYKREFWHALNLHQFPSRRLASIVYQAAVNCGTRRVARWLQAALNIVIDADLHVDGRIGNHTLHAIQKAHEQGYLGVIEDNVLSRQRRHYAELVDTNPKLGRFFQGWINRVEAAEKL